jgi:hypothetical protein
MVARLDSNQYPYMLLRMNLRGCAEVYRDLPDDTRVDINAVKDKLRTFF